MTILVGLVEGAVNESVPSIDTCIHDIDNTAEDFETAIADFRKETLQDVENGIVALGDAVSSVAADLHDCEIAIKDVEKLDKMAKTFQSPWSFAYHVGKDILVDGTDIYKEISGGITAYDAADYHTFGFDIGKALALVLVGEDGHEEVDFIQQ